MATSEIHQGDFVYRDVLFAEVGENKRHPRASVADIKDLLLPGKGNVPAKDNVAHWYEAQLLHYGLQRSKDKNTAKMRLLQAVTQGSLSVPQHLVQMEAAMKKDYAATGRKSKSEAKKADQKLVDGKTASKGTKRKQDVTASTDAKASSTKISVTVGEVTFNIDHQNGSLGELNMKKRKKTTTTEPTTASVSKVTSKAKEPHTEKATNRRTKSSTDLPKSVEAITRKTPTAKKPTGSAATPSVNPSTSAKKSTIVAARSSDTKGVKAPPSARPKQTARRAQSLRPPAVPDYMDSTDAPPPYDAHGFEDSYTSIASSSAEPSAVQISGWYSITSPNLRDDGNNLFLRIDHRQDKIWGRFDFGVRTGVIMINGIDSLANGGRTTFGWRSRGEEDVSLRFGRNCNGEIEFDGHDFVKGVFWELMDGEDIYFEGVREYDDAPDAAEIEQEWNEFPEIAYGRR